MRISSSSGVHVVDAVRGVGPMDGALREDGVVLEALGSFGIFQDRGSVEAQ